MISETSKSSHGNSIHRHRGAATAGLLLTLTAMASMATVAVVVGPRLSAGALADDAAASSGKLGDRQLFTNRMAGIFGGSHQVIAVHERGLTPYSEAVLWVEDRANPGQIDPGEIAVLCHSRVLQTVTWFALPKELEKASWLDLKGGALSLDRIGDPMFCEQWRAQRVVTPRIVATGISDMTVKTARREGADTGVLQVSVIWPVSLTDSSVKTSAHAEVVFGSPSRRR